MRKRGKKKAQATAHKQSESRISHSVTAPIRVVQRPKNRNKTKVKCADCGATMTLCVWDYAINTQTRRNHCWDCGSTFLERVK